MTDLKKEIYWKLEAPFLWIGVKDWGQVACWPNFPSPDEGRGGGTIEIGVKSLVDGSCRDMARTDFS